MSEKSDKRCILIVEDEMFLSMMLEELLEDGGYEVLKAGRLPAALSMAASAPIHAALLDINLAGKEVFPAAKMLQQRGIPFMFTSGYGRPGLPPEFHTSMVLQKPYDQAKVQRALAMLLGNEMA